MCAAAGGCVVVCCTSGCTCTAIKQYLDGPFNVNLRKQTLQAARNNIRKLHEVGGLKGSEAC